MRIFLCLTALFFLFISNVFSGEFFVDSKTGSDAADGKTPQTAWQSLKAVNRAELKPGDTVRFKRGGQWRGQLVPKSGEAGKPVTYTSYGEGVKPSFLGSVPLDRETDWIDEGGHLWSTKADAVKLGAAVPGFAELTWGHHQEEGAKVQRNMREPERSEYAGKKQYDFTCSASGSRSNHIQLIVAGFPVEAEKYYLFRYAVRSTKPFRLASIGFSEPGAPWGGLGYVVRQPGEIGNNWQVHEILFACRTDHDKARLTLSAGGTMPEGAVMSFVPLELREAMVESNGIDSDVGNIILDGTKAAFKKWTKEDLKNEDDFWYDMHTNRVFYRSNGNPARKFKSIEAALHRHVVNHSNCSYVVFDDLDVRYGAAHGFGGTKANHCVYRNLDISWIGGADQYRQGGEGRRVRFGNGIEFWADASDCLVEHCRLWEIYDAALTNQGSGVNVERNIRYRSNTIWNCEYSFEYWNRGPESLTENVLFENNVCVNAGYGWGYVQRPNKNGRHVMIYANTAKTKNLVIRNNIFCNAMDSAVRIDADFRDGLTMEGNLYWQPPGKDLFMWLVKTKYKTEQLAEYQKEVGLDKTSKLEKPDLDKFPALPKDIR